MGPIDEAAEARARLLPGETIDAGTSPTLPTCFAA